MKNKLGKTMKSDKEGRESRLCVHWGISPCMPSRLCSTSLLPPRNKQHSLYSAQFSRVLHLLPLFFPSLPSRDPIRGMLAKNVSGLPTRIRGRQSMYLFRGRRRDNFVLLLLRGRTISLNCRKTCRKKSSQGFPENCVPLGGLLYP